MDTIKVTYDESTVFNDLRHLGSRYGVSLGGAICSSPQVGLVVYDSVLGKGLGLETEPFNQILSNGSKRRVSTKLDMADIYATATRHPRVGSTIDHDDYSIDVHVDDLQAEKAAKRGMTPRQLTAFGLSSLIAFSHIHQETPFLDGVYVVNRKGSYRGALHLQKQSGADRLRMHASHTGLVGRLALALKHAQ